MLEFLFTKTPLVFLVQSFWRDEGFTYAMSKQGIFQILSTTAKDFNPPFYYLTMHFWMFVGGHSEIAMRLVSFVTYWATLYVSYLFMTEIFGITTKRAFWYLLFMAINPFLIYYAFEARMYMMLAFFVTLSSYAFLRRKKKAYVAATVLGLYTHYFMVFVVILQFCYEIYIGKLRSKITFVKYMLVAILAFVPWALYVLTVKRMQAGSFWITAPDIQTLITMPATVFSGYERELTYYNPFIIPASLITAGVLGIGLYFLLKKTVHRTPMIYLVFWALGIPFFLYAVSYLKPVYLPRYFIFSDVGLNLLLILAFEHTPKKIRTILVILMFVFVIHYNAYQTLARTKSDARTTFFRINSVASNQDVVYVTNELDYFTAEYYFGIGRVYIYGKSYGEIPDYVGKALIPPSRIAYHLPIYPKKAFVLSSETHFEILSSR